MKFYLRCVEEFHAAMKYRYPTPILPAFDPDTITLRIRLLREELSGKNELLDCFLRKDQVGTLDGLCDFQYVLTGAILALGLRTKFELANRLVCSVRIPDAGRRQMAAVTLYQFDIAINRLESALMAGLVAQSVEGCVRIQQLVTRVISLIPFPHFDWAFAAVHEANMKKLWSDEEMRSHVSSGVNGYSFESSGPRFIARRHDGKIAKPPSHKEADLSPFIL